MPRINSLEELVALRDQMRAKRDLHLATETRIIIGMGTCGIAAGARAVMNAVEDELKKANIDATIVSVGCIGVCQMEPLLYIEQPGKPRVTYINIQPDMVPRLIQEHLVNGRIVTEWAMGKLDPEGLPH